MNLVTTHVLQVDAQEEATVGLDEQLRSFWDLESLCIQEVEKTLYEGFASNITFSQGHYQVALPWKEFHDTLPDHYQLSLNTYQTIHFTSKTSRADDLRAYA